MNKDDIKKINNRIETLTLEFDGNQKKIRLLQTENNRIQGAVKELNLVLEHLLPEKKEKKGMKEKKGND